ncbi:methyltransferase, TIGR04325 family [Ensifer sp.]|uniref:methyltransferase, TIGR04325 family n=1 Tax=Ensifer sp. TaxID=1872086 RepID=UPI0028A1B64D|nr:methyltransferase, TIGR04325 family [Ensifer sp.]
MLTSDIKNTAYPLLRSAVRSLNRSLTTLKAAGGRLRYLSPFPQRFTGAYGSFEDAITAARSNGLAGYDHDEIAAVAFDKMCQVAPWDYPVLFWMRQVIDEIDGLVDAGGHMGTKYRAFRDLLALENSFRWVVYDLPAIVNAGRKRAEQDRLDSLHFVDRIADAGPVPLFLGSGLLQYLDVQLSDLLGRMPALPRHLLLNKVALRKGSPVVTLERIGKAIVPYQMRNEEALLRDIQRLGYRLVDRWSIPSLSHVIETHPELGPSESAGFYFRLP